MMFEGLVQALLLCVLWGLSSSRLWLAGLLLPPLRALWALGQGADGTTALALAGHWFGVLAYSYLMLLAVAHRRLWRRSPLALWRQPLMLNGDEDHRAARAVQAEERARPDYRPMLRACRRGLGGYFGLLFLLLLWDSGPGLSANLFTLIFCLLPLLWLVPLLRWRRGDRPLPRHWWLLPPGLGLLLALVNPLLGAGAALSLTLALGLAGRPL